MRTPPIPSKKPTFTDSTFLSRRDGSPFLNLVLIAPLYDNKGTIRYFIGAQVDITNLIEGGRGLDSLQRLLNEDVVRRASVDLHSKRSIKELQELAHFMTEEERNALIYHGPRRGSHTSDTTGDPVPRPPTARRYVGMHEVEVNLWPPSQFGPSGRLPGVYQNV